MVFQQPNPFPLSIFENVAYGPRIHGINDRKELAEIVELTLTQANLWDGGERSVAQSSDGTLGRTTTALSDCTSFGCDVLLMDEPASALDPLSTERLEELIIQLKEKYTIVIVNHNMQQAARIADQTAFFLNVYELFTHPKDSQTQEYITGQFG